MVAVLTILAISADDTTAEPEEAVVLESRDLCSPKIAHGRYPLRFDFTVEVLTNRPNVVCVYEFPVLPVDWQNIIIDPGYDTWIEPWDFEFLYRPGEIYNASITITPPFNQLNDTYEFLMRLSFKDNPVVYDEKELAIIIEQKAGCEIVLWNPPPGGAFQAIPPSIDSIRFAIYNTGNGIDQFLIRGECSRAHAGWDMEIVSGVDEMGLTPWLPSDMGKKQPHSIDVKVTIPASEWAGVTAQITINATSMFNTSMEIPPAFASVTSLQYFDFEVYIAGPDARESLPGNEVDFEMRIENLGNGWDTFYIKPIWDSELNPRFIASANPRTIDIDWMSNGIVHYIVKIPDGAPKKTFFFNAEIRSTSPELAIVTKTFAVHVGQYYSIELLSDGDPKVSTVPGVDLVFELTVRNAGNGLDSIIMDDMIGIPMGWSAYTHPPEVTLLQYQEATVIVYVIVSSRFEEAPIGLHILTVPAVSSCSDARAELLLEVEIVQYHRIEWVWETYPLSTSPGWPIYPSVRFNPYMRNVTGISIDIKNYGNGRDLVCLDWYSPDPRVRLHFGPHIVALDPEETRSVRFNIVVETDIPPGIYNVFVNATSEGPEAVPRMMPIDVGIDNIDVKVPPITTFIDPTRIVEIDLEMEYGLESVFKLKIENTGTYPVTNVLVRVFDNYMEDGEWVCWNFFNFTTPPIAVGDRFIVGERPFTESNPPLTWWANRSGEHMLEFRVYLPYQSDTTNDVSRLNLTVTGGPPSIEVNGDGDIGWEYPAALLAAVIMSVVAIGVREWVKEIKGPLRPL